jgi:hypothetical protein
MIMNPWSFEFSDKMPRIWSSRGRESDTFKPITSGVLLYWIFEHLKSTKYIRTCRYSNVGTGTSPTASWNRPCTSGSSPTCTVNLWTWSLGLALPAMLYVLEFPSTCSSKSNHRVKDPTELIRCFILAVSGSSSQNFISAFKFEQGFDQATSETELRHLCDRPLSTSAGFHEISALLVLVTPRTVKVLR